MEITKAMVLENLKALQEEGKIPNKEWEYYYQSNVDPVFSLDILKEGAEKETILAEHVFLRDPATTETILCLFTLAYEYDQFVAHAKQELSKGRVINSYIDVIVTNRIKQEVETIKFPLGIITEAHQVETISMDDVPMYLFYIPCNEVCTKFLEESKCFLVADKLEE